MSKSKMKYIRAFAIAATFLGLLMSSLPLPPVHAANLTLPKDGWVTVEFVSSEAAFIDDVYLVRETDKFLLFNTKKTRVGTVAPKGGMGGDWGWHYKAGSVLEFKLFARTADPSVTYTWSSDPAKNSDGKNHVKTTTIDANTWKMEWEDKPIPPGADFDDAVMIVRIGGDRDGDGLWDSWETNGVDVDYDGTIDLPIHKPPYNADPDHKDIFLEIDWMETATHSHKPKQAAIDNVTEAFANAPIDAGGIDNPDGKPGITLHVDVSNKVPHQDHLDFPDKDGNLPPGVGNFDTVKAANFDPKRRSVYHYCIFAHDRGTVLGESGRAECPGNDLIVSLGGWNSGGYDLDHDGLPDKDVGTVMQQAGTLMHELGHNLNLRHGGGDEINYKPNYLSVMNYFFMFTGIPPTNRLDYSRKKLPKLDETSLDEWKGIQDGTDETMFYDPYANGRGGPHSSYTIKGNGPIDWDWDKKYEGASGTPPTPNVKVNINNDYDEDKKPIEPIYGILKGYDDWENVRLFFADTGDFEDGAHETPHSEPELAYEDVLESLSFDLQVTKSVDLADAIPGDTLTYTMTVENLGKGPATKIELVDTFPDGTIETRSLTDIDAGGSTTETFTFLVPFPIGDLTVLTNTATVTGENLLGDPDADPSNNMATVSTVVHTPVLTLSKTATPFINAGEAITYTITYENTGSGDAEGVVITDILPIDVYYSVALDQGAGPAPNSVTVNVDGTTTLIWLVGSVPSGSGVMTIEYTARPSLLLFAGESVSNDATLDFTDANANDYPELPASATTVITSVPPGQDPRSLGFVRNHDEFWSDEILARIQATDDRFDGADGTTPDGSLSASEVEAVMRPGGNQPKVLLMQLLTTYFNLATRQINADTAIMSSVANQLGLANVRDAVEYARDTLELPVNKFNRRRYSDGTRVLDEINNNLSEVY